MKVTIHDILAIASWVMFGYLLGASLKDKEVNRLSDQIEELHEELSDFHSEFYESEDMRINGKENQRD